MVYEPWCEFALQKCGLIIFFFFLFTEYEDDEWPDLMGDGRNRHGSPFFNGSATELSVSRRFPFRKRRDTALYNMAVILAAVATGFDIRLCNTTGRHPRTFVEGEESGSIQSLHSSIVSIHDSPALDRTSRRDSQVSTDSHRLRNRDAYFAAVRDSFIEPESDYQGYHYTATPGFHHNTFHGIQTRFRPSVNFDVPLRFTEAVDGWGKDPRITPSTTDSGVSPHKSSRSSDIEDIALISLSPSQDKAFLEYQRQMSDTSSSMYETPKTTPKTTPQRYNVKFEEGIRNSPSSLSHQRSPSNTSSSSIPSHDYAAKYSSSGYDSDPHYPNAHAIRPPPAWRQNSVTEIQQATPERPITLDIIPRPRPHAKKTSPVHMANNHSSPRSRITPTPSDSISAGDESSSYASARSSSIHIINNRSSPRSRITPTPSDSISAGGDDASYLSARSAPSPGSTPPHIDHRKTLLDIDVEGQDKDATAPLPLYRRTSRQQQQQHPTINELVQEFLS